MTRRDYLLKTGLGFGSLALTDLLAADSGPLAVKPPHQPAQAKAVIQLFMHGGASHVDTFDYKPELQKRSGETLSLELAKTIKTSFIHDPTKAILRGSPWEFKPSGQSGLMISELYQHVREHADDLAVIKSCYSQQFDHAPAIYLMNTGSRFPGRPCLGSWVTYGLGSENQNLPALVVMSDGSTKSGPPAYSAGFLPAVYQGTVFRGGESPILHLNNPEGLPPEAQKDTLDFIGQLDRRHLEQGREYDSELEARIASYELAFRMQAEAPEAIDISGESEATKKLYGIDDPQTEDFGRKCLLARRLIERGVRFIQLISGTNVGADWDDAHTDLLGTMTRMCGKTDKPIAGLLADLKARGMFDDTLVTWSSDFGRTPLSQGATGRDHHPYGFSMWMAGAGIQGGQAIGETDDFGVHAAVDRFDAHDINATLLRLLGLDHEKLTYLYQGRDQSLTDVHGQNEFTSRLLG
ncbi:MAG: DUF1501 domain-containing protein [Acidobacteria bacterium]|nr:DUF1501 domain-containing protein [Acidobacteriota bacterium]MDA1235787.1 DUF1501 domain-containing protein [Acidobacteriota bacterium]